MPKYKLKSDFIKNNVRNDNNFSFTKYSSKSLNIKKKCLDISIDKDIDIFKILSNFKSNIDMMKTMDHTASNSEIKYTNFNSSKCDLKLFSINNINHISEIVKE